jgi:6-phosphogluconolactonase
MNTNQQVLKVKDSFAVEAGSGPRHLTFSKNGRYYVLQELTEV